MTLDKLKQLKDLRINNINRETLDYLYVKFPRKDQWKKYYVRYQNSQLLFFKSVRRHDFKCSYILYKAFIRRTTICIGGGSQEPENAPRKVDALLISHRYDDESLFLTIPEIYEKHSVALAGDAAVN